MSEQPRRTTGDELDEALTLLDHELEHLRLKEPLPIRAIGGYALIKHGVRTGDAALTADIDTLTKTYSKAVREAIHKVADRFGLERDWVNNDAVGVFDDPELVEQMYEAEWVPDPGSGKYKNIDLELASVPTLTRAKIIATTDAALSGRTQDASDLMALVDFQGIKSQLEFEKCYPDTWGEYADTYDLVGKHLRERRMIGTKTKQSAATPYIDVSDLTPSNPTNNDLLAQTSQLTSILDEAANHARSQKCGVHSVSLDPQEFIDPHLSIGAWVDSHRITDEAGQEAEPTVVSGRIYGDADAGRGPGYIDTPREAGKPVVAVLSAPEGMGVWVEYERVQEVINRAQQAWPDPDVLRLVVVVYEPQTELD